MIKNGSKRGEAPVLPATISGAKPGNFALGSIGSRAAARALLQRRQDAYERRDVILSVDAHQQPIPSASAWNHDPKDQSMGRVVSIPDGMTLAEGLRVVGGYTREELDQIAHERPQKLQCGDFLSLQR